MLQEIIFAVVSISALFLPAMLCLIFIIFTVKSFKKNRAAITSSIIVQILLVIFAIPSLWVINSSPPKTLDIPPESSLPWFVLSVMTAPIASIITFIVGVVTYIRKSRENIGQSSIEKQEP